MLIAKLRVSKSFANPDHLFFAWCGILLFLLMYVGRNQWFFGDEFSFASINRQSLSTIDLFFAPHNEHWSTLPLLKEWLLHSVFGYSTYRPFLFVTIFSHLVLLYLVRKLSIKCGANPWLATILSIPLGVAYFGAENLLWANQFCFILPTIFGVSAFLVLHEKKRTSNVFASLLLLLAVASGGTALVFIPAIFVFVYRNQNFYAATLTTFPSALAFLVWRQVYSVTPNFPSSGTRSEVLISMWEYFVSGITFSLESVFLIGMIGGFLFLLLSSSFIVKADWSGSRSAVSYLALTSLLLFALLSYSRSGLGVEQAKAPRYTYIFILCLAPFVTLQLSRFRANYGLNLGIFTIATLLVSGVGVAKLAGTANIEASREQSIREKFSVASQIGKETGNHFEGALPEPIFASNVSVKDTLAMEMDGAFDDVIVSDSEKLNTHIGLQSQLLLMQSEPLEPSMLCDVNRRIIERKGEVTSIYVNPQSGSSSIIFSLRSDEGNQKIQLLENIGEWKEIRIVGNDLRLQINDAAVKC
jgi:hypothetical protein